VTASYAKKHPGTTVTSPKTATRRPQSRITPSVRLPSHQKGRTAGQVGRSAHEKGPSRGHLARHAAQVGCHDHRRVRHDGHRATHDDQKATRDGHRATHEAEKVCSTIIEHRRNRKVIKDGQKVKRTNQESKFMTKGTFQIIEMLGESSLSVKLEKTNSRRNRWPVTRWPRLKPRSRKRTSLPLGRINAACGFVRTREKLHAMV